MKMSTSVITAAVITGFMGAPAVFAAEHPAGEAITMNGLQIAAVYLQPIEMEPRGMGLPAAQADVHLETDIHAVQGNKNGFGAGEWMPNLTISYTLENTDTGAKQDGTFMAMVASDGPHYGQNVKMMGVGNYKVTFHIEPPPKAGMYRHTDAETGVGPWWKPFDVSYNFKYVGLK